MLADRGLNNNKFFIARRSAFLAAEKRGGAPVHALPLRRGAALAPRRAPQLSHGARVVLRLVVLVALSGQSARGHRLPDELHGLWCSADGLAGCQGR